jgi:hypothetical protein
MSIFKKIKQKFSSRGLLYQFEYEILRQKINKNTIIKISFVDDTKICKIFDKKYLIRFYFNYFSSKKSSIRGITI